MTKMKTSELIGASLDLVVGQCEGISNNNYSPSTSWEQGGLIIEREKLGLDYAGAGVWIAWHGFNDSLEGRTPLIAAMRCYVASKLGSEVEITNGFNN